MNFFIIIMLCYKKSNVIVLIIKKWIELNVMGFCLLWCKLVNDNSKVYILNKIINFYL